MPLAGAYEPSPSEWVREQVEAYERTGGRERGTLGDTGLPVIILWTRGARSGLVRKSPLMRVTDGTDYALIASKGGAPAHPQWYHNLRAHPDEAAIQDGEHLFDVWIEEAEGEMRERWWRLAVEAFPPYAEYQQSTARRIPVLVAHPRA